MRPAILIFIFFCSVWPSAVYSYLPLGSNIDKNVHCPLGHRWSCCQRQTMIMNEYLDNEKSVVIQVHTKTMVMMNREFISDWCRTLERLNMYHFSGCFRMYDRSGSMIWIHNKSSILTVVGCIYNLQDSLVFFSSRHYYSDRSTSDIRHFNSKG